MQLFNIPDHVSYVVMGLGWDISSDNVDLDAGAVLFDRDGEHLEDVYFSHQSGQNGAVRLSGDNVTGSGDGNNEEIHIHLSDISDQVATIFFTVCGYSQESAFAKVKQAFCRVIDGGNNIELCRFEINNQIEAQSLIFCVLHRVVSGGNWTVSLLSQGTMGKTARELRPELAVLAKTIDKLPASTEQSKTIDKLPALSLATGDAFTINAQENPKLIIGVGWESSDNIDIDAGAVLFDLHGDHIEDVYFSRQVGQGGAIQHHGASNLAIPSAKDKEQLSIDVSQLSLSVGLLYITLCTYTSQATLLQVKDAYCRVVSAKNTELCCYQPQGQYHENAVVLCAIVKCGAQWELRGIGDVLKGRTVRELRPALKAKFSSCFVTEEGSQEKAMQELQGALIISKQKEQQWLQEKTTMKQELEVLKQSTVNTAKDKETLESRVASLLKERDMLICERDSAVNEKNRLVENVTAVTLERDNRSISCIKELEEAEKKATEAEEKWISLVKEHGQLKDTLQEKETQSMETTTHLSELRDKLRNLEEKTEHLETELADSKLKNAAEKRNFEELQQQYDRRMTEFETREATAKKEDEINRQSPPADHKDKENHVLITSQKLLIEADSVGRKETTKLMLMGLDAEFEPVQIADKQDDALSIEVDLSALPEAVTNLFVLVSSTEPYSKDDMIRVIASNDSGHKYQDMQISPTPSKDVCYSMTLLFLQRLPSLSWTLHKLVSPVPLQPITEICCYLRLITHAVASITDPTIFFWQLFDIFHNQQRQHLKELKQIWTAIGGEDNGSAGGQSKIDGIIQRVSMLLSSKTDLESQVKDLMQQHADDVELVGKIARLFKVEWPTTKEALEAAISRSLADSETQIQTLTESMSSQLQQMDDVVGQRQAVMRAAAVEREMILKLSEELLNESECKDNNDAEKGGISHVSSSSSLSLQQQLFRVQTELKLCKQRLAENEGAKENGGGADNKFKPLASPVGGGFKREVILNARQESDAASKELERALHELISSPAPQTARVQASSAIQMYATTAKHLNSLRNDARYDGDDGAVGRKLMEEDSTKNMGEMTPDQEERKALEVENKQLKGTIDKLRDQINVINVDLACMRRREKLLQEQLQKIN